MDSRFSVLLRGAGERAPPVLADGSNTEWVEATMKNLLLFIPLQAVRPVAMSLLVVFWSSSP